MKITVDTDELKKVVKEGSKIIFDPAAEEALIKLKQMKELVEEAEAEVKKNIEEEGLKYDKNFKSVHGNQVTVTYRTYGRIFKLDESLIEHVPPELYEEQKKYKIKTKETKAYVEEHGLPYGIDMPDRNKVISIRYK